MWTVIDIADAVVGELNAAPPGTFSPAFTAVRRALPEYTLSDLADLKVTVVPRGVEIVGSTRSTSQFDWQVDIGVQKKLGTDLDAEVTTLCKVATQIADYLRRRTLSGVPDAVWVRMKNDPVYAPDHLADQRAFIGVLTVTYRTIG
ncbi:MAG: hypothetical protein IT446_06555 [Phycisphaerales bacterium]|nr:hypothetical protein [Phycisphaerales bacterium]